MSNQDENFNIGSSPLLDHRGLPILTGGESARDSKLYRHDISEKRVGRDAIFLFPESYNELRKELYENWPKLWKLVGWRMANRAEEFIEHMNQATDLAIVFDTEKVDWISTQYLQRLRQMRGAA